jgi:alpha-1,2-mannosyltransferase
VAAAIKLTPLIFVPYLLVTRQWRAARNAAVTFVVATGTMIVLAPGSSRNYFTKYALDVHRVGDSLISNNQTLRAALARAGLAQSHALGDLLLVVVLVAGMTLAAAAFYRSSELLGVLLCAATGLLVSPISWQHHYVWCVPLLVWLVLAVDHPRRGVVWAALAALVFMVMPPGHSGGLDVLWYLRENAYVLVTVGLMALTGAMLWARSRTFAAQYEARVLTATSR